MRKGLLYNKGGVGLVIAIIAAVIVVGVIIIGVLTDGFGLGGGQGNGEGAGNVSETTAGETEPETLPVIEELEYLNVTVAGSEYIYQNNVVPLEELIEKLKKDAAETRVKVTDKDASKRAYKSLITALKENGIKYIEAETDEGSEGI